MRRIAGLIFGFILTVLVSFAAEPESSHHLGINDVKEAFLLNADASNERLALNKLTEVIAHLEARQVKYKSEEDFVEYLYYYTHRKLLKNYTEYPSLETTLIKGDYDCLTATAVFSILLSEMNIDHSVVETNYHIYILVYPDSENEVLLETTDPHYGFVSDQNEIEVTKREYMMANSDQRNTLTQFDFSIEHRLEQKELIGLLYYNQSIRELNHGNRKKARAIAEIAHTYYTRPRVTSLINIIDSVNL